MNLNAAQRSNLPVLPSLIPKESRKGQTSSARVTFNQALLVVNDLVYAKRGKYLSDVEITVLKGAWNDDDYEEMADNSPYSLNYLQRRIAPPLWDLLSETLGNNERITKKKLRPCLEQVTKKYHAECASIPEQQILPSREIAYIWEDQLPSTSSFYGRIEELSYLKELVVKNRCISLIGSPGIGKTALAAKLVAELSKESPSRFNCLVWKSVAHAPLLQDLIVDLIELTSNSEPELKLPKYTQALISVLINQLQSQRCLVILDESEDLFQISNSEQASEYKVFFRRLIEEQHQSCFLLTSRIWPSEFDVFIEADRPIQYLRLEGLDTEAAMQFLSEQGLTGQKKCCEELIETYRGNPAEMKAVVNRIHHFFASSTEVFFENKTTFVSNRFKEMLNNMFGQVLSDFQQQIMIYIAEKETLNLTSISFNNLLSGLRQKCKSSISVSDLVTALEMLEKQSLVESSKDPVTKEISFTLQPVIKKYILTDPQGLVHTSNASSHLAIAS
ncbi:ATP-binding protein [Komarekiella sp. 'clone 1']|uniref:ATP-binding protein n=1 Tax=Komarekiella delphini-convector SJRDD-AB1 TaxID=2593771 RepID=A0AA40VVN3_9NOST|nr:ATP-binding protein [Komarekiella delphini-convector]MBD6621125.1 ATP-binding protein [Komarekiella delphini-convector SJRDD-AB1]